MDPGAAKTIEVIGIVIIALALIMFISVAVMLATGARFVPIMAAPLVFLGIGIVARRAGRRSTES